MNTKYLVILFAVVVGWSGCSNPFAPSKHIPEDDTERPPAPPATTPEQLIDNLHRAMRDRDKDLYETLLDGNFWFTETDCLGDVIFENGLEQELEFIGGSRDGSRQGIFEVFRTFEFDFEITQRGVEPGIEHPINENRPNDPDAHPDEDWEVFRGRVQMLMRDENGDGFRVDQVMIYKLRQNEEGLWKMIRWIDDPLSGDCSAGKRTADAAAWSALKQLGF
ncbi:MAG: hypothetical protein GKR89_11360 [Candidatus Latescibacteria bacterium]|nr:hypothetical protein [Candidatus Latescibacterota bacterium]